MNRWEVLINLINENDYRNIAEIGVHRGKTVRKILQSCKLDSYGIVDPVFQPKLSKFLEANQIVYYYDITTSELASKMYVDGSLDLVFLDALHDYDHVLQDIKLWQPKVREGGILCGDDYGQAHCEGVKQAVDEVFGNQVGLIDIGRKGVKIWVIRL